MRKIPHCYAPKLLAFFTSMIMSFIMSMVITSLNLGWVEDFPSRWMHAWLSAFLIAFPIILLVLPLARRIVGALTVSPPTQGKI
jgi:hypothetical protein